MSENITVALAGNPNSGKTTMFNAITGAHQRVGNYPGITVERKEGTYKHNGQNVHLIDIPGTYSLTAYSLEEVVAREVLVDEKVDVVVDIIDATALERSLYLAVQFMELGIPLILALNMMDEVKEKGIRINSARLSELLKVPVVETVALKGVGKEDIIREAVEVARRSGREWKPLETSYGPDIDPILTGMTHMIEAAYFMTQQYPARWIALKYLEGDEKIIAAGRQIGSIAPKLEEMAAKVEDICQRNYNSDPEAIIADYRYGFINSVLRQPDVLVMESHQRFDKSDRLDKVLAHKFLGPIIMVAVLYAVFHITFTVGEYPKGWLEAFFGWLGGTFTILLPEGLLQSLIVSGIIGGVGSVLSFVPLIFIMFALVTFMEDLGYMARVAYMMDRVVRLFGLHGASVMPLIISGGLPGGCAVPGVMAARTLKSPKERLATIITAPFQVCGAKIPVFILLVGAFFEQSQAMIMFLITLGAWAATLVVSRILRWTVIKGESTPFIMELPPYRLPTLRGVLIHTWDRAWQYLKKAGTIILAIAILLWAAMTFPQLPASQVEKFEEQTKAVEQEVVAAAVQENLSDEDKAMLLEEKLSEIKAKQGEAALEYSVAGRLGHAIEPVMSLAGFNWQTNIALIGGFAAKEVIVVTLGTAYSLGEVDPEEAGSLTERIAADPHWTLPAVLALIIFVLLYAPCFVTVVAMARESSWNWALFALAFNTGLAFVVAVIIFQVGSRI
ncbi:MAG: ferrous iron transport protein B [Deltaproteobacteria bacterium]|nr:ferrous iron transport protein B [Deltaproteobacteria bacterium]